MAEEKKITFGEAGEFGWKFLAPETEQAFVDDPSLAEMFRRYKPLILGGLGVTSAGLAMFGREGSKLQGLMTEAFGLALDVRKRLKDVEEKDATADKAEADHDRFVKTLEASIAKTLEAAGVHAFTKGKSAHLEGCPDMPAPPKGWKQVWPSEALKSAAFCKKCELVKVEKVADQVYIVGDHYHPATCPYGDTWKARGFNQIDRARAVSLGLHRCGCHHAAKPARNVRADISTFFGDALTEYRRRNP